ncbi:TRAP transporter small permease subunit [Chloroflexota bacterium]
MKALSKVAALFDWIINIFAFFAALLLIFIMVSVTSEVILRSFFNRPQVWVIELSEYSLLFIAFLGATWLLRNEGHVKMDLVLKRLAPRIQSIANIINSVFGMVISSVLVWYGALVTWDNYQRGLYFYTILETPTALILVVIPVGSILLFIQFMRRTYGYLERWRGLERNETMGKQETLSY